jgi:hypothetical protein
MKKARKYGKYCTYGLSFPMEIMGFEPIISVG